MARRAQHVLFDRAHRKTHLNGDVGIGLAVKAAKQEDGASSFGQSVQ